MSYLLSFISAIDKHTPNKHDITKREVQNIISSHKSNDLRESSEILHSVARTDRKHGDWLLEENIG